MPENKKVQYLIVDTSAFLRNAQLQDIGGHIITEEDVVSEIKNKRQLRRLVVLPYDLSIQNADPDNIKFVTEFAKKTGDYCSLSATDIKVIALTLQLEKEKVGTDNVRSEPVVPKTVDASVTQSEDLSKPVAGFYVPHNESGNEDHSDDFELGVKDSEVCETQAHVKNEETDQKEENENQELYFSDHSVYSESDYETAGSDIDKEEENVNNRTQDIADRFSTLTCNPKELKVEDENETEFNVDQILPSVKTHNVNVDNLEGNSHTNKNDVDGYEDDEIDEEDSDDSNEEDADDEDDEDDDSGWITPRNITSVKKEIDSELLEEKPVTVACLTMDFAMQNVLKQMGLNVVSLDGRLIKQMRTYIFRCHACFKTTSIMTKVFCPSCGNKTLKKVAVSLDEEGNQQIHINFKRPISTKGKRFSLPMPKGGKHASNPILCEDQPLPDQRPTRLARTKNDPLRDDYIAGYSPFIMRDVNSKSAMLGIRPGGTVKYWMKRNPNENRRKRK